MKHHSTTMTAGGRYVPCTNVRACGVPFSQLSRKPHKNVKAVGLNDRPFHMIELKMREFQRK
jgi:hypothetical protein